MQTTFEDEAVLSWYVSRALEFEDEALRTLQPGRRIVAADGSALVIRGGAVTSTGDFATTSFEGVLSAPGRFGASYAVELAVSPFSDTRVEFGLRPARRPPASVTGARRYFNAAWGVLDEIADHLAPARVAPFQAA
jgi:hypothetical protein